MMSRSRNVVVEKSTIHRLAYDIKQIMNSPLTSHGIYYAHDYDNILKGYALIIGPKDTPYENGYYFFNLYFPVNYPHSPPKATFLTSDGHTRFNPNLYVKGKVCLSILNTWQGDAWTGCQNISSVLLSICSLLNEKPLLNEPGIDISHPDMFKYNEILKFKNFEVANIAILKNKTIHPGLREIAMKHFISNYDYTLSLIDKYKTYYKNTFRDSLFVCTNIYAMFVIADYESLKNKMACFKIECEMNIK